MAQPTHEKSLGTGFTNNLEHAHDGPRVKSVCVIGAGYVGATTAVVLAYKNPDTSFVVVDTDDDRICAWRSDVLPIHEPLLADLLDIVHTRADSAYPAVAQSDQVLGDLPKDPLNLLPEECRETALRRPANLRFSAEISKSIEQSELIFVAVNTPFDAEESGWDLSFVDEALRTIAQCADSDKTIVLKSTVPCGTAERASLILRDDKQHEVSLRVLSNPEFLRQGHAVEDVLRPARVVIGFDAMNRCHDRELGLLLSLYSAWVPSDKLLLMSTRSAELVKLASNAMIAQRISTVNSLSALCESTGARLSDVTLACGMDPRIGPSTLQAGLGFGGSCLEKDLQGLVGMAADLELYPVARYWEQVSEMNEYQGERIFQRILRLFNGRLAGVKVACLGFAFKSGTADAKCSLAGSLIQELLAHQAQVSIHDPLVMAQDILAALDGSTGTEGVKVYTTPYNACFGAELVVITMDAEQYRQLQWGKIAEKMKGARIVYDIGGVGNASEVARHGISFHRVGDSLR